MMTLELYVKIDVPLQRGIDEGWLRRVVHRTLDMERVDSPVELSVVITDAGTIRRLNKKYRGEDEDTDVLAFALAEDDGATPFVMPPDDVSRLGEVLVSYPRAQLQAEEHGHSVQRELALLVAHGVLHLLGHDHGDDASAARMRAVEDKVLKGLSDGNLL
jgi:probable rRNA maturation factor